MKQYLLDDMIRARTNAIVGTFVSLVLTMVSIKWVQALPLLVLIWGYTLFNLQLYTYIRYHNGGKIPAKVFQ